MIETLRRLNPFKRSLSGILATFQNTVADLRAFAERKTAEVEKKEAKVEKLTAEVEKKEAKVEKLTDEIERAVEDIEDALNAADNIENMIGGLPSK